MSFRYQVEAVHYLASADLYVLDGRLESGTIKSGSCGVAMTSDGEYPIQVMTVALVNHMSFDSTRPSLSIAKPPCPLDALRGSLIVGSASPSAKPWPR